MLKKKSNLKSMASNVIGLVYKLLPFKNKSVKSVDFTDGKLEVYVKQEHTVVKYIIYNDNNGFFSCYKDSNLVVEEFISLEGSSLQSLGIFCNIYISYLVAKEYFGIEDICILTNEDNSHTVTLDSDTYENIAMSRVNLLSDVNDKEEIITTINFLVEDLCDNEISGIYYIDMRDNNMVVRNIGNMGLATSCKKVEECNEISRLIYYAEYDVVIVMYKNKKCGFIYKNATNNMVTKEFPDLHPLLSLYASYMANYASMGLSKEYREINIYCAGDKVICNVKQNNAKGGRDFIFSSDYIFETTQPEMWVSDWDGRILSSKLKRVAYKAIDSVENVELIHYDGNSISIESSEGVKYVGK